MMNYCVLLLYARGSVKNKSKMPSFYFTLYDPLLFAGFWGDQFLFSEQLQFIFASKESQYFFSLSLSLSLCLTHTNPFSTFYAIVKFETFLKQNKKSIAGDKVEFKFSDVKKVTIGKKVNLYKVGFFRSDCPAKYMYTITLCTIRFWGFTPLKSLSFIPR